MLEAPSPRPYHQPLTEGQVTTPVIATPVVASNDSPVSFVDKRDCPESVARENILVWCDTLIHQVGKARTKRLLCQIVAAL